jgi:hypothetical protein
MVGQIIYLEDYDWAILVFYEVDYRDTDLILSELENVDCEPIIYYNAAELLEDSLEDTGFTYTSVEARTTFIIMMKSSCADEF